MVLLLSMKFNMNFVLSLLLIVTLNGTGQFMQGMVVITSLGGYHIEKPIFFSKHMNFKFMTQKSETLIFSYMLELAILQTIEQAK